MNSKSCYKEEFWKTSLEVILYLDPEVIFHTNDVRLKKFYFDYFIIDFSLSFK
jgi:hypothetical protein